MVVVETEQTWISHSFIFCIISMHDVGGVKSNAVTCEMAMPFCFLPINWYDYDEGVSEF